MVIITREDEEEAAQKSGLVKPVVMRHYGDSRRDTLLKLYRLVFQFVGFLQFTTVHNFY